MVGVGVEDGIFLRICLLFFSILFCCWILYIPCYVYLFFVSFTFFFFTYNSLHPISPPFFSIYLYLYLFIYLSLHLSLHLSLSLRSINSLPL